MNETDIARRSNRRILRLIRLLSVTLIASGYILSAAFASQVDYTYDDLGRLTSVTYEDGTSVVYSYDAAGNRTSRITETPEPNSPPVAVNDFRSVQVNGSIYIAALANDSDPDGDALSILSVTQPSGGVASITSETPNRIYFIATQTGSALFNYTISDGNGGTDTATVVVNVTGGGGFPL